MSGIIMGVGDCVVVESILGRKEGDFVGLDTWLGKGIGMEVEGLKEGEHVGGDDGVGKGNGEENSVGKAGDGGNVGRCEGVEG